MRIPFILILFALMISCNEASKEEGSNETFNATPGVITKISSGSFEDTYTRLQSIISDNPNLKIIAEIDHGDNAKKVGLTLNPTRLIVFGNPSSGTPLMINNQTVGLDLPLKILVWQDNDGVVKVSYNDPAYLENRHVIKRKKGLLDKISNAMNLLTDQTVKFQ